MPDRSRASFAVLAIFLAFSSAMLHAQHAGNTNTYYQALRGLLPGGEVIAVDNLELHRDAATFTFRHGNFAFYGEVNGKVTGAVFKGDGHLHIAPPTAEERHNLSVVVHSEEFDEDFDQAVLRFTDETAAELHKGSAGKGEANNSYISAAQEFQSFARTKLHDNFDLRLLQGVASPAAGGYFMAAMHGHKAPHLIFIFDPQGAEEVAPEEVELMNWNDWGPSFLLAFHRAGEYANGAANGNERNASYRILSENLDVSIEKGGFLSGTASVELRAEQDGVAVVPLDLYPTLRVSRAETDKGDSLDFVQERKEDDADFGVVLAKPLKKGESQTIRIAYAGKDVVKNEGGANYYPIARESWYPSASSGLGNYASYHMTFHVPKGLELLATGTKVNESTDGKVTTTEWKTEVPLAMVGFNLGSFAMKEAKIEGKQGDDLTIDAYANKVVPDSLAHLDQASDLPSQIHNGSGEGSMASTINTTSMLAGQLSQGQVAAQIYSNYFGPLPFNHVAITQQYACTYGQSWPMLVYLPICAFFDDTQKHFLGLGGENLNKHMYWKVVTPHEVAHQWWGQTVGFRSYRDQWMSEGFADASASIFLQATRPKPDEFLEFWKEERRLLTEKNQFGFRPMDVGPVTMGFRLSSPKAGWNISGDLIYPKGAYILHMIRMMMWSRDTGDQHFKETMHDFLSTYRLQAATTEDFKAIVEKHMSQQMDLDGNHRMDWFFNQYVYGTDLPNYRFESDVSQNANTTSLHFKLTQSGVGENFKMLVPIYLETADGKFLRLGSATIHGSKTVDQTVQLPKFPSPVKRALINYYYDVLSTEN